MCWRSEHLTTKAAANLRREIIEYVRRHAHSTSDVHSAELIIGELLANVARYAPGPVCVDLDWRAQEPTIVLHDAGPGFEPPLPTHVPDAAPEGGRGLYLIALLSRQLIAEHVELGGMRMRATLPVTRSVEPRDAPCPFDWPFRSGRSCPYSTTTAAARQQPSRSDAGPKKT